MGSEALIGAQMRALGQQPDVEFAEDRGEAVGVVYLLYPTRPDDTQAIVKKLVATENGGLEKSRRFSF